eukprot:TRINITY_DN9513_c0_g1_i2.p1 TRINITY_DN9513_c0_g1~~TRINITY_DN9513_c0_g1_i2.p1  ORF type:complete len:220 (+),score=43.63 TRINITY_DN9513_c0_g1_i2:118-777(+)
MSTAGPAIEKYQLQHLLPGFAMFPKTDVIAKTSSFYGSNQNKWNRKAQSSEKFYNQYHKYNDNQITNLQKIQEKLEHDRLSGQRMYTSVVLENRQSAKRRLEDRKMERIALQVESQQVNPGEVGNDNLADSLLSDPATTQKVINRMTLNSISSQKGIKSNHAWNDHLSLSKKYLEFVMTPSIIESDFQAVQLISKRIATTDRIEAVSYTHLTLPTIYSV